MTLVSLGLKKLPAYFWGSSPIVNNAGASDNTTNSTNSTPTPIDYNSVDTSFKSQMSDADQLVIFLVVAGICAAVVIAIVVFSFVAHTLANLKMNEADRQERMVRLIKRREARRAHTLLDACVYDFHYIPSGTRSSDDARFGCEKIPQIDEDLFVKEVSILLNPASSVRDTSKHPSNNSQGHLANFSFGGTFGPPRVIEGMLGTQSSTVLSSAREVRAQQEAEGDTFVVGGGRLGTGNPLAERKHRSFKNTNNNAADMDT